MIVDPKDGRFAVIFLRQVLYPVRIVRWSEGDNKWQMFEVSTKGSYRKSHSHPYLNPESRIVQFHSIEDCLLEMSKYGLCGALAAKAMLEEFL